MKVKEAKLFSVSSFAQSKKTGGTVKAWSPPL